MSGVNRSTVAKLAAAAIVVVLGSTAPVGAQPRNAPDAGAPTAPQAQGNPSPGSLDQAARLLFESARTAFGEGDYTTALARFRQAYEASPRPGLLFNIATTLDRLRQDDEALATFERFLAADPNVANRTEIEARIRVLRAAIEQREQAAAAERERVAQQEREAAERAAREQAEREARETAEREREGSGRTSGPARDEGGGTSPLLFYVAGGLTVVAGGLSVWAGLDTLSLNDDYETYSAAPGALQADAKLLYDEAASRQLLTNLFLGGTALFGVATAVLFFLTDWGGDAETPATASSTRPTLTLDANGGVAGFVHRF
jgi:tetratricopeptide (TPR) repeat protein